MRRNIAGGFAILPSVRNGKQTVSVRSSAPEKELDFLKPAITGGLALGSCQRSRLSQLCKRALLSLGSGGGGLAAWFLNKQRPGRTEIQ